MTGYFSRKDFGVNIIAFDFSAMPLWNIIYFLAASNAKNLANFVGDILRKILILDLQVDMSKGPFPQIFRIILKYFPNIIFNN